MLPLAWRVRAAAGTRIRANVASDEGARMLDKYALAVERMREAAPGNSTSWLYQWYIHAIPNRINNAPATKDTELTRVFGISPTGAKTLATETWNTCQAHRAGADPDMFLGWHRLYLLAFEDVVRGILGDDDFNLPYWDYTTDPRLPEPFRQPQHRRYGALYRENRNRSATLDINAGDPMDKEHTVSPFSLDDMTHSDFSDFSAALDGSLHGAVHVGVGNRTNMGAVPTAAGDPIFWLHHSNIDRIWAGWNAAGGKNPSTSREFVFADRSNQRWARDVASVNSLDGLYGYDDLPKVPEQKLSLSTSGAETSEVLATSSASTTQLLPTQTRIALKPTSSNAPISSAVLSGGSRRFFVVIEGVNSRSQPGTMYEAFLDLPVQADRATLKLHYLGTFNFFNTAKGEQRTRFDATGVMQRLSARQLLNEMPSVTIVPVQVPDESAQPVIGTITVERQ